MSSQCSAPFSKDNPPGTAYSLFINTRLILKKKKLLRCARTRAHTHMGKRISCLATTVTPSYLCGREALACFVVWVWVGAMLSQKSLSFSWMRGPQNGGRRGRMDVEERARATQCSRAFCVYTAVQVPRPEILLSETSRTNIDRMFVRSCSRGRKHFPVKQLITTIDRIAVFSYRRLSFLSQALGARPSACRVHLQFLSTFQFHLHFFKQPI